MWSLFAENSGSIPQKLSMQKSYTIVLAAWSATVFGLLEGIVLCISRAYPANLAPYKVSTHILWITPVVNLLFFTLIAFGILILGKWFRRRFQRSTLLIVVGFFVFIGIVTVITSPAIIHSISAVLLSLGLTVTIIRGLRGSENQLADYLRRRLAIIPLLIATIALGVAVYEDAGERWAFRKLPAAPTKSVNVLVVVMDTVRRDKLDLPAERSLTPNLDRIMARGVRFEEAWATSSWSLPSQASILTGRYPHEHGADWPYLRLTEEYPTLGEFFSQRGYVTGAFSGNAAWVTPEYLGRGFLRFNVYTLEDLVRRTVVGRLFGRPLSALGYHPAGRGKKAPEVNRQFLQFLDDYQGRPFFTYLCYMDVNQSFHNRRLNRGFWEKPPQVQEVTAAYDHGLTMLDAQIGNLFAELERRDIMKNTLVVLTSDHGESFGVENTGDNDPAGHGTSLYPEQTRVPLCVIYPGRLSSQTVNHKVSATDIPAMITRELGFANSPFKDRPMIPPENPDGLEINDNRRLLATLNYDYRRIQSIVWGHWQYIYNPIDPGKREELYDLRVDPHTKNNLVGRDPVVDPIRDLLKQMLASDLVTPMSSRNSDSKTQLSP
jgi:arylsulfatase A-like enzyme